MKTLRAEGLKKIYGKRPVVRNMGLEVKQGEVVGILGPNGAGKTTTFQMVVGAVAPDGGDIFLDDHVITFLPMHKRAGLGIGYLPQEASIFRKLTVEENIRAMIELRKDLTKASAKALLDALVSDLNVGHIAGQKGYQLSGGERRRVEIARALVMAPVFLLLDEPFTGIDPIAVGEIQEIVHRLKAKGIGVLITDHNVRETLEITDRSYIVFEGEVLLSGTSQQLVEDPKAREVYLGARFRL